MKSKILVIIIIISFVVFLPFSIAFFMEIEVLYFASGAIDSWILFWGSYVGAIIGSIVVYFVANSQLKKQHEQQIKDVKSENELLYQHDVEGYLLRNKLSNLDIMFNTTNEFYYKLEDINEHIDSVFIIMYYYSTEPQAMTKEEFENKRNFSNNEIRNINLECRSLNRKLQTSGSYFPEMHKDIGEIDNLIMELDREIVILFNTKDSYKHFMTKKDSNITILTSSLPQLLHKLPDFMRSRLRNETIDNLHEVKKLANDIILPSE